jgi:tRNA(Ile)-lysidine synthase
MLGEWKTGMTSFGPPTHEHATPVSEELLLPRFDRELRSHGFSGEGERLLVAFSGGLDSLVLLHLLRFGCGLPNLQLHAAHFDHGMRPGSEKDAHWARGICRAWDVPIVEGRAYPVPTSENEARERRYEFLFRARETSGTTWILTAHHADDQAETVLFRILRGTGLTGLGGIPRRRRPRVLRPLLSFPRRELEGYAASQRLRPREDPSNLALEIPRNFLRHSALPALEANVAPGARRALVRLARMARENEKAWDTLLPVLLDGVLEEDDRGAFIVRPTFLAYHPTVQVRLLREVLRKQGLTLNEVGTRAALEFTRTGASGRSLDLPGGLRLTREFDRFLLAPPEAPGQESVVTLNGPAEGSGEIVLGGRSFQVRWGCREASEMEEVVSLAPEGLAFPLRLRAWCPGDRIALPYGTKKLKKLFAEAGIAAGERGRIPVLVDASGAVLWAVGVAVSTRALPVEAAATFTIGIGNGHQF